MSFEKVAVVTGSNKGIGFGIVKGLCQNFEGIVYLTARDVTRGLEAVRKLNDLGLKPLFHQLDIDNQGSIDEFKRHMQKKHGGIDILVNNAAIGFKRESTETFSQLAEKIIAVNYFSLLRICETLFPLMRSNGRVVNLSSSAGHLSNIQSLELRKKLGDPSLTVEGLSDFMNTFIRDIEEGKHEGWGKHEDWLGYVVSKVGCSALSFIQQRHFDKETPNRNISVNAVHPGFVDTDMTSDIILSNIVKKTPVTIEEGAEAPLYLALGDHNLKGKYIWNDKRIVDWYAESIESV